MRPTRCYAGAVQPLRALGRSHRNLDPAIRLAALSQEHQRIWGDAALPAPQASFRRELQSKATPYNETHHVPARAIPQSEVGFNLQRRLALCSYHRALIRMPKLFWIAQPGTENPATVFARLPEDRQHRQFIMVFTSLLQYQAFAANMALPNHTVEEADGDSLGGIIAPLKAIARMHLIVDPSPDFSSHRGVMSAEEFRSYGLQQSSLHISEYLKSSLLPERDSYLESHVFSYLADSAGNPYSIESEVRGKVVPVFLSDVHLAVQKHALGSAGEVLQQQEKRYGHLKDRVKQMSLVAGIVLDSLPADSKWTGIVSDEMLRDTRHAYFAERRPQ